MTQKTSHLSNRLTLVGLIGSIGELRYTPAGLPAIEITLDFETEVIEAEKQRMAKGTAKCLALGKPAKVLRDCQLGERVLVEGFLAAQSIRNNSLRVHIQNLERLA